MRYLLPAVLFSVLVVFFWVGLTLDPSEVPSPLVGKPAPSFELPELSDASQVVSNETLKGKPAVITTGCPGLT